MNPYKETTPEDQKAFLRLIRSGTAQEMHKEYWSKEEIKSLRRMFYEGCEIGDICRNLGRTERTVMKKVNDLSLYPSVYKRHPKPECENTCLCSRCPIRDHCSRT